MALPDGSEVQVAAGQTCLVEKGTRFQPRFPVGDTEYIPARGGVALCRFLDARREGPCCLDARRGVDFLDEM